MTDAAWKIPGGGNSFPFDNFGDFITGLVFEFEPNLTQTDGDGKPKTFPGGAEKKMHRVGLHVLESSNPQYVQGMDVSVYLKGGAKLNPDGSGPTQAVVLAAIKGATGMNDLQPGAKLTLQYTGELPSKDRMTQPTKLYKAWYVVPAMGVPGAPADAAPVAGPTVAAQAAPVATPQPVPAPVVTQVSPAGPPVATPAQPAALTPEQEAAIAAALAPATPAQEAWETDPRVAPLRAKGVPDATIRSVLGI
jgi:hypothetical protein